MHTVENAVIIPVFTLIIVALISVSGYMHDRVVMQNILNQTAIECANQMTEDEVRQLLIKSEKYIDEKTLFLRNIHVRSDRYTKKTGEKTISGTAECPLSLGFFGLNLGNISMSHKIYQNSPEELIRKVNIVRMSLSGN